MCSKLCNVSADNEDMKNKNREFLKWLRAIPEAQRRDRLQKMVSGGVLNGTSARAALKKLQIYPRVVLRRLDIFGALVDAANAASARYLNPRMDGEVIPDENSDVSNVVSPDSPNEIQHCEDVNNDIIPPDSETTKSLPVDGTSDRILMEVAPVVSEDNLGSLCVPCPAPATPSSVQVPAEPVPVEAPAFVETENVSPSSLTPMNTSNGVQSQNATTCEVPSAVHETQVIPPNGQLEPVVSQHIDGVVEKQLCHFSNAIYNAEMHLIALNNKIKELQALSSEERYPAVLRALLDASVSLKKTHEVIQATLDSGVPQALGREFYPRLLKVIISKTPLALYSSLRLATLVNLLQNLADPKRDPTFIYNSFIAATLQSSPGFEALPGTYENVVVQRGNNVSCTPKAPRNQDNCSRTNQSKPSAGTEPRKRVLTTNSSLSTPKPSLTTKQLSLSVSNVPPAVPVTQTHPVSQTLSVPQVSSAVSQTPTVDNVCSSSSFLKHYLSTKTQSTARESTTGSQVSPNLPPLPHRSAQQTTIKATSSSQTPRSNPNPRKKTQVANRKTKQIRVPFLQNSPSSADFFQALTTNKSSQLSGVTSGVAVSQDPRPQHSQNQGTQTSGIRQATLSRVSSQVPRIASSQQNYVSNQMSNINVTRTGQLQPHSMSYESQVLNQYSHTINQTAPSQEVARQSFSQYQTAPIISSQHQHLQQMQQSPYNNFYFSQSSVTIQTQSNSQSSLNRHFPNPSGASYHVPSGVGGSSFVQNTSLQQALSQPTYYSQPLPTPHPTLPVVQQNLVTHATNVDRRSNTVGFPYGNSNNVVSALSGSLKTSQSSYNAEGPFQERPIYTNQLQGYSSRLSTNSKFMNIVGEENVQPAGPGNHVKNAEANASVARKQANGFSTASSVPGSHFYPEASLTFANRNTTSNVALQESDAHVRACSRDSGIFTPEPMQDSNMNAVEFYQDSSRSGAITVGGRVDNALRPSVITTSFQYPALGSSAINSMS